MRTFAPITARASVPHGAATRSTTRRGTLHIHQENISRIYHVVMHIERAIDTPMPLEELAAIACFSPFHFQRMFKEVLGETPKQYIKRLRLEEAARIITFYPERSILDVALQVGFKSLEVFSRAFKNYYSVSPDAYRKAGDLERVQLSQLPYLRNVVPLQQPVLPPFDAGTPTEELQVDIVHRSATRCVCVHTTLQSPQLIRDSFGRVQRWAQARDLRADETKAFGLIRDYPIFTALEKCRFLACVAVPSEVPVSGLVRYVEIPASKYARFEVDGGVAEMLAAAAQVVHSWLPGSGYALKLEPILLQPAQDPASTPFDRQRHAMYVPVQAG